MRLSENQLVVLSNLDSCYPQGIDDTGFCFLIGNYRKATLASLERKGLIAYYPYGNSGKGWYKITEAGKVLYSQQEKYNE